MITLIRLRWLARYVVWSLGLAIQVVCLFLDLMHVSRTYLPKPMQGIVEKLHPVFY
jgi:hypothetical protein